MIPHQAPKIDEDVVNYYDARKEIQLKPQLIVSTLKKWFSNKIKSVLRDQSQNINKIHLHFWTDQDDMDYHEEKSLEAILDDMYNGKPSIYIDKSDEEAQSREAINALTKFFEVNLIKAMNQIYFALEPYDILELSFKEKKEEEGSILVEYIRRSVGDIVDASPTVSKKIHNAKFSK